MQYLATTMVKSLTPKQIEQMSREEAVARFWEVRGEIAEALKDLSEEEYDGLVSELTDEVNAALADHVRRSRGEIEELYLNARLVRCQCADQRIAPRADRQSND